MIHSNSQLNWVFQVKKIKSLKGCYLKYKINKDLNYLNIKLITVLDKLKIKSISYSYF